MSEPNIKVNNFNNALARLKEGIAKYVKPMICYEIG